MTGQEAIAYIHSYQRQAHAPGLERMRILLDRLGNPQKQLRFVHVAGTNGKGSTCACMAAVLQAAGYRVGLNTSPYLITFHERIRVNGEMISDEALAALTEEIRPIAESMAEHPSEFELVTAIAFLHFLRSRCDVVVLEVGLGGALDASNVIDVPEVAVITALGMDHMAQLGPTLRDIAAAKAGIIKPGGCVVSYGGCPEADEVIRSVCREQHADLTEVDFSRLSVQQADLQGNRFDFLPHRNLELPLAGAYQPRNAAAAITALECLARKGWSVPEEALRRGLAAVQWPGRFEVLRRHPAVILDGAHNAHGMRATVESLRQMFPGQRVTLILGILEDKDVEQMLDLLTPVAGTAFVIRPESPRAMAPEALCARLECRGVTAYPCPDVQAAVDAALRTAGKTGAVCALGSLYSAAAVRQAVQQDGACP